jgi:hypothetical protein
MCAKLELSPTIHILSEKIETSLKKKLVRLSFYIYLVIFNIILPIEVFSFFIIKMLIK